MLLRQTKDHLIVPAPPAMLSAAALNAQSAAAQRHIDSLSKPSSYVLMVSSDASPRPKTKQKGPAPNRRPTTAPAVSTKQGSPRITYTPNSKLETLALALDIKAKAADHRARAEGEVESASEVLNGKDRGRERAMCSSPREKMTASARQAVMDNIQKSVDFAGSLDKDSDKFAAIFSPPRERGSADNDVAEPLSATPTAPADSMQPPQLPEQAVPKSANRPQSSSFASTSKRFSNKAPHVPPVGHYTARYSVIEPSPRKTLIRDSRTLLAASPRHVEDHGGREVAHAENDNSSTPDVEETPATAPLSARERTKARLASAPISRPQPLSSSFASNIPQLFFQEMYIRHHQGVEPYSGYPTATTHNADVLSNSPRVMSASFAKSLPRKGEAFMYRGSAPQHVLSYNGDLGAVNGPALHGNVDFNRHSGRRDELVGGVGTSVYDADIIQSMQAVTPRTLSVPNFDKGADRPPLFANEQMAYVSSDSVPDRRALLSTTDKHAPSVSLQQQLPRKNDVLGSDTAATELYELASEQKDAMHFPRKPATNFNMRSSHHEKFAFSQLAEQRIASGHVCRTEPGFTVIDAVRPRIVHRVALGRGGVRGQKSATEQSDAAAFASRVDLENVDSPLRHKRTTGDPKMSVSIGREQRSKEGYAANRPVENEKFYDVSYLTSGKVKLVPNFRAVGDREKTKGTRLYVEKVNEDNIPGPGTYL